MFNLSMADIIVPLSTNLAYGASIIYPDTEGSELESNMLFLNRRIEAYKGKIDVYALNLKRVLRAIEERDRYYLNNLVREILIDMGG